MKEQVEYKKILKKMIVKTEADKIQSTEQMIQALIKELTQNHLVVSDEEEKTKSFAN